MPTLQNNAQSLIEIGKRCHAQGWVPATGGNFSIRLDPKNILVTQSGFHKGELHSKAFMTVGPDGTPTSAGKPSAETLLHCQCYRQTPTATAVLHNHSVAVTVLSRHADEIRLRGYELAKVFGTGTHACELVVPVFDNDQDMHRLVAEISAQAADMVVPAYMIRGHGLYTWASSLEKCWWQLEALEFMFACELAAMQSGFTVEDLK